MSGSKGGKKTAEYEELTEKLYRLYKKKCNDESVPIVKSLEEKFNEARENTTDIREIYIWDEVGFIGVRMLLDAMREVEYPCVHFLRFWRSNCEDEGVRAVIQFMEHCPTIKSLEFMGCNITALGCEFLGRVIRPEAKGHLKELKLDHNVFGNEGIKALAEGLRGNSKLEALSLSYCGIDHQASDSITEILASKFSALKRLNLQGNRLGNEGIKAIFPFLALSPSIETLIFADNGIHEELEPESQGILEEEETKRENRSKQFLAGEDKQRSIEEVNEETPGEGGNTDVKVINEFKKKPHDIVSVICSAMLERSNIKEYDWRLNEFTDVSGKKFLETLQLASHVSRFDITDKLSHQLYMDILAQLKLNKPKKKGKKGKKGKKKKAKP